MFNEIFKHSIAHSMHAKRVCSWGREEWFHSLCMIQLSSFLYVFLRRVPLLNKQQIKVIHSICGKYLWINHILRWTSMHLNVQKNEYLLEKYRKNQWKCVEWKTARTYTFLDVSWMNSFNDSLSMWSIIWMAAAWDDLLFVYNL